MKKDKINPGPKDEQFTKAKNLATPRGTNKANKGASHDKGHLADNEVDSEPGDIDNIGDADMADQQFDDASTHRKDRGSLKSKTPGEPGKFNSQELSPAMKIMREVAKAAQKPERDQTYQGSKKVSSASSPSQSKDFKATTAKNEQARPKTSVSQKFTARAPESKKGSKT